MNFKKTALVGLTSVALLGAFGVQDSGVKADNGVVEHVVQPGETLSIIADKYLGDIELYTVLAEKNDIDNPHLIYPGEVFVVNTQQRTINTAPQSNEVQETVVEQAPKETPEQEPVQEPVQQAEQSSTQSQQQQPQTATHSTSEARAKEIIAQRESNGRYYAVNPTGKYIGRYQLDRSYLNGDHSPANQERVVENYVADRYGSWNNALAHWNRKGWY